MSTVSTDSIVAATAAELECDGGGAAASVITAGRLRAGRLGWSVIKNTAAQGAGRILIALSRLVIAGSHGEVLIPLVAEICTEIDVRGRRIVVSPPDGLLELNEPGGRP